MPRRHLFKTFDSLFGPEPSPVMQQIIRTLERVAVSDLGILIVGETGTGKNWLAGMIHRLSGRANRPITNVDCAAMTPSVAEQSLFGWEEREDVHPGVLEEAVGGTILFNKMSSLAPGLQMKIIRTFENRHYRRIGGQPHVSVNARAIATIQKKLGD